MRVLPRGRISFRRARSRCALVAFIALAHVATAGASEPDEPSASAPPVPALRGDVLVPDAAAWRWQIVTAPRLAPQIGALAISGLDVVAGRAAAPIDVLGQGTEPARWPFAVDDDAPALATIPRPSDDTRIAAAYGVTTFTLTPREQGLVVLELRMRYQDGAAAWLNGVEVMRRALPRAGVTALAERPHGPEWETVYIAVAPGLLHLGRNVLAIELHPSGRRDAPMLAAELRGRRDLGIVRGPVLAAVDATSAKIVVDTDPDTAVVLEWGTGGALDQQQTSPPGARHELALTNLPAKTQVRYRVRAGGTVTPIYAFHTAPAPGDVVRIGIYGDVRGGHAVHAKLVDAMLGESLDLVGVTGDMVLRGADDADWQRFFAITEPLLAQVLYLPSVGNHDLGLAVASAQAATALALPPAPAGRPAGAHWYSYELADVHLVFLDSNAYDREEQLAWLDADLAAARARNVRAIIALTHDGPYSRGYHRGNVDARTRYVPILARHRVDLVLSGHDHLYQRGEAGGIRYVVTGGGGASLYAPSCGIPGKRRCAVEDGMQALVREHHYLVLTIGSRSLELCPRRVDGRLLERCTRYSLRR